jgi:Raf kinase inhibitor-like YbhB/YbcL family protein
MLALCSLVYANMAKGLVLTSSDFQPGRPVPAANTCDGSNQAPALSWTDIPTGTKSLALVLSDPDAPFGVWIHWVAFNIPENGAADLSDRSVIGNNSWGKNGYSGPCPPVGQMHHYLFVLYALDTLLDLPQGATAAQMLKAAKGHILGQTQLIGTYRRSQ